MDSVVVAELDTLDVTLEEYVLVADDVTDDDAVDVCVVDGEVARQPVVEPSAKLDKAILTFVTTFEQELDVGIFRCPPKPHEKLAVLTTTSGKLPALTISTRPGMRSTHVEKLTVRRTSLPVDDREH